MQVVGVKGNCLHLIQNQEMESPFSLSKDYVKKNKSIKNLMLTWKQKLLNRAYTNLFNFMKNESFNEPK